MEFTSDNSNPDKANNEKRTYHAPELVIYGNIRELTKNVGPTGALDNGGGQGAGPKTR